MAPPAKTGGRHEARRRLSRSAPLPIARRAAQQPLLPRRRRRRSPPQDRAARPRRRVADLRLSSPHLDDASARLARERQTRSRWMAELGIAGTPPPADDAPRQQTTRSRAIPTSSKAWKSSGPTTSGSATSPTSVWAASSSTLPFSWTSSRALYAAGIWAETSITVWPSPLSSEPGRGQTRDPSLRPGVQYAATGYVERLKGLGVTLSMAAVGEPRENGYASG